MDLFFDSPVGARIKYYRLAAGKTQKQLAEACNITEPAIRNYELGNRIPSFETLMAIAAELDVSFYALADPDIGALGGALHTLFRLEQAHGLSPVKINGKVSLQINPGKRKDKFNYFEKMLEVWAKAHELVEEGTWTIEDYKTWQSLFPYSTEGTSTHPLSKALSKAMILPKFPIENPFSPALITSMMTIMNVTPVTGIWMRTRWCVL